MEFLIDWFFSLPHEWLVFFSAMLPVIELRGAIPLAMGVWGMNVWQAYFWSVLGNFLISVFVLFALEKLSRFLMNRFQWIHQILSFLFKRTERLHTKKIEYWGAAALILFVAIPLPMTGAWSACFAAFVFRVPVRLALVYILTGLLISGVIVSLLSLGVIHFF